MNYEEWKLLIVCNLVSFPFVATQITKEYTDVLNGEKAFDGFCIQSFFKPVSLIFYQIM